MLCTTQATTMNLYWSSTPEHRYPEPTLYIVQPPLVDSSWSSHELHLRFFHLQQPPVVGGFSSQWSSFSMFNVPIQPWSVYLPTSFTPVGVWLTDILEHTSTSATYLSRRYLLAHIVPCQYSIEVPWPHFKYLWTWVTHIWGWSLDLTIRQGCTFNIPVKPPLNLTNVPWTSAKGPSTSWLNVPQPPVNVPSRYLQLNLRALYLRHCLKVGSVLSSYHLCTCSSTCTNTQTWHWTIFKTFFSSPRESGPATSNSHSSVNNQHFNTFSAALGSSWPTLQLSLVQISTNFEVDLGRPL